MLQGPFEPIDIEPPGAIGDGEQPINLNRPPRPGETIQVFSSGWESPQGIDCNVLAAIGVSVPEVFPAKVLSFGPAVGRPGLFDLRVQVPEEIRTARVPLGELNCVGADPMRLRSLRLYLPLHR